MPGHENQITAMEAALKKPCSVGSDTSVITVSVDPDDNVKTIKEKVKEQKQISIASYSLKKGSKILDDNKRISEQGIKANDELTIDHKDITVKVVGITNQ
jgi:ribosome biogenesis GTPase A